MITIKIEGELEKLIANLAADINVSSEEFTLLCLNKFAPLMHTMDKESMAKGYAEMGELNVRISEGEKD